ncbi:MAG: hypothetical protein ACR2IE_04610 [Candidatus Sumerlaeaceae bacterium]
MKTIDKFYGRFGEDVKGVVYAKAKPDGDIKHLLTHLGLPVSGVIDRQHRILVEFIHTHGKTLFIKAVGLSGGAIAVKKLIQDTELQKVRANRARMHMAHSADIPRSYDRRTRDPSDNRPRIEVPTYSGPDRRALSERRIAAQDRRQLIEMITFKNRRFGGRRRKGPRRHDD